MRSLPFFPSAFRKGAPQAGPNAGRVCSNPSCAWRAAEAGSAVVRCTLPSLRVSGQRRSPPVTSARVTLLHPRSEQRDHLSAVTSAQSPQRSHLRGIGVPSETCQWDEAEIGVGT
eukprot:gene13814-biopygen1463